MRLATGRENPKVPARTSDVWKCVDIKQETANPYQPKVQGHVRRTGTRETYRDT